MDIRRIQKVNATLVMRYLEERDNVSMKIVGFTAILLVLVYMGVSFAADPKLKQSGSELCFSCHEEERTAFNKQHVHSPVRDGDCTVCHNPHTAKYEFMLSESMPELCYSCHTDEAESFNQASNVHTAVKQGKCAGCHDPHASDNEHLQKKTDAELCYSCHEQEAQDFRAGEIHSPVEAGECFVCHEPHASGFHMQLVDAPRELCLTCHDAEDAGFHRAHEQYPVSVSNCISCHSAHSADVKDPALVALAKGLPLPNIHTPFGKKMCDSCHLSSDSADPLKLRAPQIELCYRCHSSLKETVDSEAHVHTPAKEGLCTSCHVPHASKYEKLAKATGKKLCADCHPDLMKKLDATYAHEPAVNGECQTCHKPHSSEHNPLLTDESVPLCQTCHPTQVTFTHPIGEGIIDPRTEKDIVTCVSCHDSHGDEYEFILLASRERDLCFRCHKM